MKRALLDRFCDPEREKLAAPVLGPDGMAYASDGKVGVRVARLDDAEVGLFAAGDHPLMKDPWPDQLTKAVVAPVLSDVWPDEKPAEKVRCSICRRYCDRCFGLGTVECPTCGGVDDFMCPECHGARFACTPQPDCLLCAGTGRMADERGPVRHESWPEGLLLGYGYVRLLREIGAVLVGACWPPGEPVMFRFDGGTGALMPMRSDSDEEVGHARG